MDHAHKTNELDKLERRISDLLQDAKNHEQSARVARTLADKLTNDRAIMLEAHTYSQEELEAAFNLVANPDDWKAPIYKILPNMGTDVRLIRAAICHFTATIPQIKFGYDTVVVSSIGYRAGPAGDH